MRKVERTVEVYAPQVGGSVEGSWGAVANHMIMQTYPRCKVESRNTYKGVPLLDLPAHWAAEDAAQRQDA